MTSSRALAVSVGIVLMLLHEPSAVFSASSVRPAVGSGNHVAGEVLVKFRPSRSSAQKQTSVGLRNHAVIAELDAGGWMQVRIAAGQTVAQALAAYQNDPIVESVQPNFIYRAAAVPNDPQYGQLWGMKNTGQTINSGTYVPNAGTTGRDINIEKAWDHITDCSSVVVAVLDTGVNYNHDDVASNMWDGGPGISLHGFDFVDNDNDPMDGQGHGTHVAGTIAARGNNGLGVTGVCWRAAIMAVRVLDASGSGTTATIIQGIGFAVTNGARVINMSLGGGGADAAYFDAISQAQASDVVVVAAAGNETTNVEVFPSFPCSFTHANVLCVAALDQNYALASFSNYGAASVDIGAPGTNINSALGIQTTTINDDFNNLGALDATWNNPSGAWDYALLSLNGVPVEVLVNPADFPSGTYANSANHKVYKEFNTSGKLAVVLNFSVQHELQSGDFLNVNYRTAGGDPFGAGGVQVDQHFGTTLGVEGPLSLDISPCISATCSVGFQLSTNASGTAQGVGIVFFSLVLAQATNTMYGPKNGTSMATPLVAGLATMLRAYNPQYTYVEVVNAIRNGGRSVAALSGITTTGRAIDVMSSLAYINPPSGLSASVVR
jgi:thermitase